MPALTTDDCYKHAGRFSERVALITGAGSGFGRALAIEFVKLGAYVVLGDVDMKGLDETCGILVGIAGDGSGVFCKRKCDVTSWEDQLALFDLGVKSYGHIDIVLPNAGVTEVGRFDPREDGPDTGAPTKPNMKTLDIDLIGVLYTARIALWHWEHDKRADKGLRALVLTGSMSTFYGSDSGVMYGVAKAGMLGIMKGVMPVCDELNIRVATVCPYFSKTGILTDDFVHPNPSFGFAKVEDVVSAFIAGISDPDPKTNYGAYLIPDAKGVYRMEATRNLMKPKAAKL